VEPTIFITPSGNTQEKIHPKLFCVPYSSHSNFTELQRFVRAIMPFKLSFIVPYRVKGVITQRGPEVFLKSYVRKKPIEEYEEFKVQPKSSNDTTKEVTGIKMSKKRTVAEANLSILAHKGKKLKGATFINTEVVYSLPSPKKESKNKDKS